MLLRALTHYMVVGLFCAFAGGWVLTLIINGLMGNAMEARGLLTGEPYWFALLTTCTSLAIIVLMTVIGNRLYRTSRFGPDFIGWGALLISSGLFMATIYPFIGPQLLHAVHTVESHLHYTHHNPEDAVKLLSLPVLKWCLLPTSYLLAGRFILGRPGG